MKVAILGATGMLGKAFCRFFLDGHIAITRDDCDFTDFIQLKAVLDEYAFDVLINCAANVSIDSIEKDPLKSLKINSFLPFELSQYCKSANIKFVHISTDHFYEDGILMGHTEQDAVVLKNHYAKQKFVAEMLIDQVQADALTIRTNILGFKNGVETTLLEWILKTIKSSAKINGFYDAFTSAVSVDFLTTVIGMALERNLTGTFNIGTAKPYSKLALIEHCIRLTGADCEIERMSVSSLKVSRSTNSGLDVKKIENELAIKMPDIEEVINGMKIKEVYDAL